MISGQLRLRVATTSAKPTRWRLRPKTRCEIGSLIIEPAIKCGTREQTLPHHHSGEPAPGAGQGAGFPITIRPGKSVIRTAVREGTNAAKRALTIDCRCNSSDRSIQHHAVSIVKMGTLTFEHAALPVPLRSRRSMRQGGGGAVGLAIGSPRRAHQGAPQP